MAANNNWKLWCRLCAKTDYNNNINVFFKKEFPQFDWNQTNITAAVKCYDLDLISAIEKYFFVTIEEDADLPKSVCTECFSLVTNLVNISERITKVQKLFCILKDSSESEEINSQELKSKLGLVDDNQDFRNLHLRQPIPSEVHYFEEKHRINAFDDEIEQENPLDQYKSKNDKIEDTLCMDNFESNDNKINCSNKSITPAHTDSSSDYEEGHNTLSADENNSKKYESVCAKLKESQKANEQELQTLDLPIYHCTLCPKSFKRINSFQSHMARTHQQSGNSPMQCLQCNQHFKTQHQLKRHSVTHLPSQKKKVIPCPFCEKVFPSNWLVQSHVKNIHSSERAYICEKCGIGVNTNVALKSHMLTHTDFAPFECDICKKCFKTERRLRLHKNIHDPNKHICSECGLELNSRVTLNRHLLVHSDKMQHKCDYCGREFKRAKALKNHLILHTGLKPYSCDFCDRTFANGSNCRTHKKKAHPEELAALESSGGSKPYTLNIPKLNVLKAITKNNDNLAPVVSKQSGCFAFKKLKLVEKKKKTQPQVNNNEPGASIPTMNNIYNHIIENSPKSSKIDKALKENGIRRPCIESQFNLSSLVEQKIFPNQVSDCTQNLNQSENPISQQSTNVCNFYTDSIGETTASRN